MIAESIAGIDIGTGSIKAVVLNTRGEVINKFREFYPETDSNNEQDVVVVYDCFKKCVGSLFKSHKVSAICLSSAMHSILAVDSAGDPLMKAILWSDDRSREIAERLRSSSLGEKIYLATGTPIHSMSPLCKLKWLFENNRNVFDKAHKFISIKEYIWYRLFSEYVVDHSIASATGLFNLSSLDWNAECLDFIPLDPGKLSKPVPPSYTNSITESAELNITSGTQFIIGGSDGCLANLGCLCLKPNEAAVTIGTSAAVRITSPVPVLDYARMNFSYILDKELFVCGGPTNNVGNIIEWLVNDFTGGKMAYEDIYSCLDSSPAGCEGLIFLPYLNGERAPVWDEESRGVFFGISQRHNQSHFIRASVEGLCYALKQILESMEVNGRIISKILLSGGVASSKEVVQILADVTGKQVGVDSRGDASAIGAGYFGLKTLGFIDNYDLLEKNTIVWIQPIEKNVTLYKKYYRVFESLYPALKGIMDASS